MARTRTRLQIATMARRAADCVGDSHISDAEVVDWIDQDIAELWDMLVAPDPDRYSVVETITTTAGTLAEDLPEDFYQVRAVDRVEGSERIPIDPWKLQERGQHRGTTFLSHSLGFEPVHYRVMGQGIDGTLAQIHFLPDPGTATYEIRYVQAPQLLVADDDVFDGVAGWEEWVILSVAIRMLIKQDRDSSGLERQRARIEARIEHMAGMRDAGAAPQVADTRGSFPHFLRAR